MDDLAQFLADRYDEAEARARVWQHPMSKEDFTHWQHVGQRRIRYDNGRDELFSVVDVRGTVADWAEAIWVKWDIGGERAAYIADVAPARRLADITLKRAILARALDYLAHDTSDDIGGVIMAEDILRQLGAEFDQHPGYQPGWAP